MRNLIRYIANRSVGSDFTKKLDDAVTKACHNKEWERDYMLADQQILQWKREGKKEGREEGRAEGEDNYARLIKLLTNDNRVDDIVKSANDAKYRKSLMNEYGIM